MATRMEAKQRPHKRFVGAYELGPNGGPYTTATRTGGKSARTDRRGFPDYVGINGWYAITEAAPA